jgi:hypothetical protein
VKTSAQRVIAAANSWLRAAATPMIAAAFLLFRLRLNG